MTDSNIEKFSEEEAALLVSLPYRAGVWISEADDEEGGHDDTQEEEALAEMLKKFAGMEIGSPFTKELAESILGSRHLWPKWQTQIFTIVEDSREAIKLVEAKLGKGKAKNYRLMVLRIASHVAKAADEFDDFNPEEESHSAFGGFIKKVAGTIAPSTQKDKSHEANISPAERTALEELSAALAVDD